MRKPMVIAAATLVAAGIGSGVAAANSRNNRNSSDDPPGERRSEARYTDAHRGGAAVSQSDAERTALARHRGRIVDTHLENERHRLVWEVKPDDGTQVWEVQVDAKTGAVVSDQHDE
jgi:uncharacterized membrane protein YkoI